MPISFTFRRRSNSKLLLGCLLAGIGSSIVAGASAERLRAESSAFLQANADSLVDWMPWGNAVFERAKREQKPVFVAVGMFTGELSRAMARQTFANANVAALLNSSFVCVLVDREEHPEVAAQFLAYVRTLKQLDGWPLNVWLTPELKPYEGATYLSPTEEWGKPSFTKVAQQAKDTWASDPAACRSRAADAVAQLAASVAVPPGKPVSQRQLDTLIAEAAAAWRTRYDTDHGGFGDPPRSAEPELLRFLLRRGPPDRDAALGTLRAVARSALRDPLDGGFFRSADDAAWRVPHPQKLLSDQTRIALAFLDAVQGTDTASFEQAARGALDYALDYLALADGTFAAGEDGTDEPQADYYAWTATEIDVALGADASAFKRAHGAEAGGNIASDFDAAGRLQGKNILRSALPADATQLAAFARLRAIRARRPALPRDNRATCGTHGLLLAALARAGEQLHESRYLEAAEQLLDASKKQFLLPDGSLRRVRGSMVPASPTDYAALAWGCRELARVTRREETAEFGRHLLTRADEQFFDATSGRYMNVGTKLPTGIFARVPTLAEIPSAESLALAAGAEAKHVALLRNALSASLTQLDPPPGGDVLLALAPPASGSTAP